MKIFAALFLASSLFFIGCSNCSQCHLTTSPSFNNKQSLTLLILPVTTNGNPNVTSLPNYSDDITTPFLEAGFKIVDRSAAEVAASKLGLSLNDGIAEKNVKALASALNVDAILLSSVAYAFIPAESGVTPSSYNKVTDSTGKVREVSAQGPGEYNRSEHYAITSMSSRLIEAKSMTTLLTAYVEPCDGKAVNAQLVSMLREELTGKD